jgi:hypothetical protein
MVFVMGLGAGNYKVGTEAVRRQRCAALRHQAAVQLVQRRLAYQQQRVAIRKQGADVLAGGAAGLVILLLKIQLLLTGCCP